MFDKELFYSIKFMVVLVRIPNVVYFARRHTLTLKFVLNWIKFVYRERDTTPTNFYRSLTLPFPIVGRNPPAKTSCWRKLETSDPGSKYLLRFPSKLDAEVVHLLALPADLNTELKEDLRQFRLKMVKLRTKFLTSIIIFSRVKFQEQIHNSWVSNPSKNEQR